MRKAACRRVRARTMRGRAGGAKALASPLGESRCPKTSYADPIYFSLLFLVALLAGQRFGTDDVIGLDPAGGADSETGFCARGEFAGGLVVAAKEGGLCGSQIGLREIPLSAIGHCELGIAERRLGLSRHRRTQNRNCFLGVGLIIGCHQRLPTYHLDERCV